MPMLLKQEIAEKLSPQEYNRLCHNVEATWHQAFGVVSVKKRKGRKLVVIELHDKTRKQVAL